MNQKLLALAMQSVLGMSAIETASSPCGTTLDWP
jgi:hypothetical protein